MKKLLVLLAVALVMCVPKLSIAESKKAGDTESEKAPGIEGQTRLEKGMSSPGALIEVMQIWKASVKELLSIAEDLWKIRQNYKAGKCQNMITITTAMHEVRSAAERSGYVHSMLNLYSWDIATGLYEDRSPVPEIQDIFITTLQNTKSYNGAAEKTLQWAYSQLKNEASSFKIDEARDIVHSTLPLVDRSIKALKPTP